MPTYRVTAGHVLPHQGAVLEAGAELELPAHVAADPEIAYRIEPVAAPEPPRRRQSDLVVPPGREPDTQE